MYTTVEIAAYDITLLYIFMLFIILFHVFMTQKHAPNTGLSLSLSLCVCKIHTVRCLSWNDIALQIINKKQVILQRFLDKLYSKFPFDSLKTSMITPMLEFILQLGQWQVIYGQQGNK